MPISEPQPRQQRRCQRAAPEPRLRAGGLGVGLARIAREAAARDVDGGRDPEESDVGRRP